MIAERVSGPRRGPPSLIIAGAADDFAAAYDGRAPFPGSARPPLRIAFAVAGSMSFGGDPIGWVAIHRRHHAFTDRPGDPHSPYRYGTSVASQLRGLAHAHAGWLLRDDPSPPARYAFGTRPFTTRLHDRATNLWPLALVSFGGSWHNMHHSDPACARHGAERGQVDISAGMIRIFEHVGWATSVHWPDPDRPGRPPPQLQSRPATACRAGGRDRRQRGRDDLIDQRKTDRAYTTSSPGNGTPRGSHQPATSGSRWNRLYLPDPNRRQACTHNRGTASPPRKLLLVHPPQQITDEKGSASREYRQEDRAQGRSS